jgi:hypothetical protein
MSKATQSECAYCEEQITLNGYGEWVINGNSACEAMSDDYDVEKHTPTKCDVCEDILAERAYLDNTGKCDVCAHDRADDQRGFYLGTWSHNQVQSL